jgi:hypothetical protein
MPIYEPSLKLMNTFLNAETRNVLSCSVREFHCVLDLRQSAYNQGCY